MQLRIFDRLYRIADNDPTTALLLIGDPKQSIYRFRGADIHSYLSARRKTAGRHHMLATNHRSTAPLVAAVNYLFSRAEGRAYPASRRPARRLHVRASPRRIGRRRHRTRCRSSRSARAAAPSGWSTSSGAVTAMQLVFEAGAGDADGIRRRFAQRCAEQIATLLNDDRAGFDRSASDGFSRLHPADIAVLVRTGREARRCAASCSDAESRRSICPTRTRFSPAPKRPTCCTGCAPLRSRWTPGWSARHSRRGMIGLPIAELLTACRRR